MFCISSPLCDRVIGFWVLLAAFLQWGSSTLQAVWWESRLLCGSAASRTQHCQERRDGGILHTIALLFGFHFCTICVWPHSNSGWYRFVLFVLWISVIFLKKISPSSLANPLSFLWSLSFLYVQTNLACSDWKGPSRGENEQNHVNRGVYTLCPCALLQSDSGWLPVRVLHSHSLQRCQSRLDAATHLG